jgi:hypothetical protein
VFGGVASFDLMWWYKRTWDGEWVMLIIEWLFGQSLGLKAKA